MNAFKSFTSRDDISVILITQSVSAQRERAQPELLPGSSPRAQLLAQLWRQRRPHPRAFTRCLASRYCLFVDCALSPLVSLPLLQIAGDIRYLLNVYDKVIPTVLEIPSKDKPYVEEQDPIMQRVLKLMGSRD